MVWKRKISRIDEILEGVVENIQSGRYPAGSKLPSLRQFASANRVSKSSAVAIYERLVAIELVEVRGQKGFFVRKIRKPEQDNPSDDACPSGNISKRERVPNLKYYPSGGWIDASLLPLDALKSAMREASRTRSSELMRYNDCRGYRPLRDLLVKRMLKFNIESTVDNILITDSASMAFDLLCRVLLKPGDTILLDDPTSLDFASVQKTYGVTALGVPFKDGLRDLSHLKSVLEQYKPKLYFLAPVLHNPTGTTITTAHAFELLSILKSAGVYIIEDDVFSDIAQGPSVRLSELSNLKGVGYISSFSKTVSAGLRCGYIVAETEIINKVSDMALDTTFGLNSLTSIIVHKLLQSGFYRRNLNVLCREISVLRNDAIRGLKALGFEISTKEATEGVFIWARWTGKADAKTIYDVAINRRVQLAIGPSFSLSGNYSEFIRFNCTLMTDEKLWDQLRNILQEAELKAGASKSCSTEVVVQSHPVK